MWMVSRSIPFLAVLQIVGGATWAAYELAMLLMFFETIPRHERTSVLTIYNLGNSRTVRLDALIEMLAAALGVPARFEALPDQPGDVAVNRFDAWGGPDRGHEKFTALQQAMAYTMSSVLTTGGIRGGENQADRFQPRSFNMGMSRKVFEFTGGFTLDRLAEDIDLSIRMKKQGFRVGLIPEAFVYHKRRTNLQEFFKQVQGFGRGRVRVGKIHPGEVKITHWFPAVFLMGLISIPFLFLFNPIVGSLATGLLSIYLAAIFFDGLKATRSSVVALLGIPSAMVQLTGYGLGFLKEKLK